MARVASIESPEAWEAARTIRFEVFVEEQQVPAEEELDALDAVARHWLVLEGDEALATARAVAKEGAWKIGRVAVRRPFRGRGLGNLLMRAILEAGRADGVTRFVLESQTHAIAFYERLGFVAEGPEFLDAGIPHRRMGLNTEDAGPAVG